MLHESIAARHMLIEFLLIEAVKRNTPHIGQEKSCKSGNLNSAEFFNVLADRIRPNVGLSVAGTPISKRAIQINNVLVKFCQHTQARRSADLSRRVAVNQTSTDWDVADGATRGSMHASVDVR